MGARKHNISKKDIEKVYKKLDLVSEEKRENLQNIGKIPSEKKELRYFLIAGKDSEKIEGEVNGKLE